MAKKNALKVREEEIFDFHDMSDDDAYDEETMIGVTNCCK